MAVTAAAVVTAVVTAAATAAAASNGRTRRPSRPRRAARDQPRIALGARWSLRCAPPDDVDATLHRLAATFIARRPRGARWHLSLDADEVAIHVGPAPLTAEHHTHCTEGLRRWRAALHARLPVSAIPTENLDVLLWHASPIDAAAAARIAEIAAPALLLLAGNSGEAPLRLEPWSGGLRLTLPANHHEAVAPSPHAIATALLLSVMDPDDPDAARLLRFPDMVERDEQSGASLIPQRQPWGAALPDGRATRISATTSTGDHVDVYAQQALTVLALHAQHAIAQVMDGAAAAHARATLLGETPLSVDHRDISAKPQPTLALLEYGEAPRSTTVRLALLMARDQRVRVIVCPWYRLHIERRGATVRGLAFHVERDRLMPVNLTDPVAVTALHAFIADGSGSPGDGAAEQAALRRLDAAEVRTNDVSLNALIDRIMMAASRRGVRTTAVGGDLYWALKTECEYMLRAATRMGGGSVQRPETHVATAAQVPLVIESLRRRGLDCIVKLADGTRAEGTQVVPAGGAWQSGDTTELVVQHLRPHPLLVAGHKADLRCYLLVDAADPSRSRRLAPILLRRAAVPYVRGDTDAEITNTARRMRQGLPPDITPLHLVNEIEPAVRDTIVTQVDALLHDLAGAQARWSCAAARSDPAWTRDNRIMVWGVDVLVSRPDGAVRVDLLEINVHPLLFRDDAACDALVDDMVVSDMLPALLGWAHHG